jgi:hypothetical protein
MGDLKTETTAYPVSIDTATVIADGTSGDEIVASNVNGPVSAVLAIESELGTATDHNCSLKGTCASLAERLSYLISESGGIPGGTSFPTTPTPIGGQLFRRTDYTPVRLYYYDDISATWRNFSSVTSHAELNNLTNTDDHTQYVHNTIARTISAQHTLTANPPFIVSGTNEVANLHAATATTATSSTTATTSNKLIGGSYLFNIKTFPIGDWNMDIAPSITVTHETTRSKIRGVHILIRNDADTITQGPDPMVSFYGLPTFSIDDTFITINRTDGGIFDNTNYDSTSYNRGWITLMYVD